MWCEWKQDYLGALLRFLIHFRVDITELEGEYQVLDDGAHPLADKGAERDGHPGPRVPPQ